MENLYNKFYLMFGGNNIIDVINNDIDYILNVPSVINENFINEFVNKINNKINNEEITEILRKDLNALKKLLLEYINTPSNKQVRLHVSILNAKNNVIYILKSNRLH